MIVNEDGSIRVVTDVPVLRVSLERRDVVVGIDEDLQVERPVRFVGLIHLFDSWGRSVLPMF
jgi:hypothetical protein